MPTSNAAGKRKILVASHSRFIENPPDAGDLPIVERMTRKRFENLSPAKQEEWVKDAFKNLETMKPDDRINSILNFMKQNSDSQPGPPESPMTDTDDTKTPKKKPKYSPVTPEGTMPWQRDGITAAILCYSPYA